MKKIVLSLFLILSSSQLFAFDFNTFQEVDKCIKYSEDLEQYKKNFQSCLDSKNLSIENNLTQSFKTKLPKNFHERVDFGKNVNQFIDKKYIPNNPEFTIDEFIKKYPNHIFTIDSLLRGKNAIISDYQLRKLDLLPKLFSNIQTIEIIENNKSEKQIKQETNFATLLTGYFLYLVTSDDEIQCNQNASLSQTSTSIDENSSDTIDFTISGAPAGVTYSVNTSGTATEGTDYESISDITINSSTTTFSLTLIDDSISDINETVDISLTPTGGDITFCKNTLNSQTITIVDNEAAPTITLSASASSIAENAGSSITLTATSSIVSGSDITVSFDTSGTATEGTDYGTISDITISAGSTTGTTTFTPTDDSMYETSTDETATVAIGTVSGGGATESGSQSVTLTIEENDSAPTVTLAASSSSIAENAGTSITLTATLSNPTSADVTVSIGTSGSATEGTDYGTISDITISSGDTTGTASFTPTDDNLYETSTDETATVSITGVSGGSATESGSQSVTLTIEENESAPTVTLTTSATNIDENSGSSLTLTATLSVATTADVTVTISTSGSATEGTDYTDGSGNIDDLVISAGNTTETISFKPTDDSVYEGDETATISIDSVSGGEASENGTQAVTITINENESAPTVTLSVSASSIAENSGSTLTITATSSIVADENITVGISTSGTATEGTDYGTISDITITAGNTTGTATFDPTDDSISDVAETAIVAISSVSGADATESGSQSVTITINDNEATPTVTLTVSATSIAENAGSSLTLTATSSIVSGSDITVTLSTSGTATEGTDYGSLSDITISAGSTTGTTTFTPTDDSMYETSTDETATVAIDTVSGGSATENGTQSVTITINENESAPTVTLAASATSIAENAGSSITITASLSGTTSQDVTVSLSSSSTATEGTDYGTVSDITITSGSTSGTATFTPTDDSIYDATSNETAILSISGVSGGGATESGDQKVTITITDNESAPTVTLSVSATSIAENAGSSLTLTATLSGATFQDVTVGIDTSGGATEGTDYTDGSGVINDITISAGSTSGTVNFTPTDDSVYEDDESATISIGSVSGGGASESGTQSVTITISENESAPTVTLSVSATSIAENAGSSLTITATLSGATDENVTVGIDTAGTATEGTDYTDGSGNLDDITISAGSTTGTVSFTPSDDSGDPVYEENETAIISIGSVSGGGATESGSQSVTITITENESAPTVTLTRSAASIAENSGSSVTLTATLSIKVDEAVTVSLSTSGAATEGTDYTDGSGNLDDITISAGSTTGTVSFTPTDDSVYEGDEAAVIAIDTVSGGGASEDGTQSVTVTISENESAPTVTLAVSATSIAENSGSSLTLTATLSNVADENVTVSLSTSGAATEGTDYTDGSGNLDDITITAGSTTGTVSFTPTDDSVYEDDEAAVIAIDTVSGADATESGTQSVTVTITENESAPTVTLAVSATSIAENAGSSLTLTATLSGATDETVTVALGTSGSATEGTDYTDGSGNVDDITISAGSTTGTVNFTPTNDSVYEGDETATIAITGVSGGGASESGSQSVTITISEDESAPTVTLSVSATSIAENAGSSLTLTATLSGAADEAVIVALSTSGTSTEGTDYTDGSGNIDDITISAGSTTGTVNFTPTDDSVYEGNETAIVAISSVSGADASESGSQSVTITITENESAPTITLTRSAASIDENSGSTITLTATISGVTDSAVTVALDTSGTATEGTDYGTISDITISAGATTGTATLDPTDDNIYEGDETATIDIASVSGKSGVTESGTQQVSVTIAENESAPTVTLATSATSIAENAGTSLTLTATLSVATTADVTVALSTSGTATEGTDYTDGAGNLDDIVISAGSTTGTVSFTPTNDSLYDAASDETATIAISGVSGGSASESGSQSVTITITDDDSAPTVTLAASSTSIAENSSSTITLTATLSNATYQDVTVSIGTSGTATEGTDYGNISDITISAGSTTGTATFDPTDDSDETDTVTATIAISGVSGGGATESGSQSVTISILDDESVPRVTLTVSATSIAENAGTSLTLTATLSKTASEDVTVTLGTSGAATEGTDYGSLSNITVTAGALTGTTTFTPTDDSIYDATSNETATVSIDSVSGGDALENGTQSVTITITDNESAPTVTLSRSAAAIDENSSSTVTITATLSNATYQDVTVSIGASGGTEGTDYATISDITISAGSTTGTTSLDPTDDSVYEDDEVVTVTIDGVSGGSASESGSQSVSITITENESAPTVTLSVSATSIAENAGTSLTLTATLSGATDETVTVGIDTGGTSTEGTDYTDGSGNVDDITISAGSTTGTVNFTPTDDSIYEGNETAIISIGSVSGGGASESGTQSVTITITENESAPTVALSVSATSIAENSGSSLTITATLSGKADEDVTVTIGTGGTSTEGTDYTDGSGNLNDITISANSTTGTVTFTPTDDSVYEGSETAIVSIDGVSGADASEDGTQAVTITITDNESAPTVTLAVSATSIAENAGSSLTLTATLSGVTDADITVTLDTAGTATEGTDYTDGSGNIDDITISAGATTGTVSFTPTDDSIYDATSNETATISINGVSGKTGVAENSTPQAVTITITDNESAPTVTLTSNSYTMAEDAGGYHVIRASLSGATYEDVTVSIDGTGGTATEGTDFGTVSDITISAGNTLGTTTFTAIDDSIYEGNETAGISVSGVSGGGASESSPQAFNITITENESAPTVTLSTSGSSIAENAGSSLTLTATLSVATTADVTVALSTSGTATEGTDYTDGSGAIDDITISAGSTTGTVNFTPTNDSVYEGDETATIAISSVSGGSATESGSQSVTITISEDESAPTVTLSTSATSIAENAGSSLTITATLSTATTADVTVTIGTAGTATEGTDYTDGSGNLDDITISAGSTTGTVSFTPTDDASDPVYEENETAIISIDGVSGGSASESGSQSVTITITENESAPTVTLARSAASIAENSGSSVTLTATLSIKVDEAVTVALSTSGAATEGTDYTDGSGNLDDITISAGNTTGTVSFTPTDDSVYEDDEAATIAIDTVSGGGASESGSQSVTVTITENESEPTVTLAVSATSIAENAGTSLTLTATLSGATDQNVTVVLGTSGTATEGTDYTDGSGNVDDITISAGSTTGTVSFTPTDDSVYEGNETATIAISSVTGEASESGTQAVTITITENESAPTVTLSVSATSIAENAGTSLTLTATLSGATDEAVTVALSTSGTATEGTDYTDGSGSIDDITISAGSTTGTVNFTPTDDSVYEGSETATIAISSVSGGSATESGSQSVTITITDNESAGSVTLTVSATSIAENAGTSLTITATLSSTSDEDVTVALSTSGTATEGTDYTDGSGAIDDITISAGATTGTVNFTPTDDSVYEGNETATIAISSVSGGDASESGDQSVTVTITENESAPTVTLSVSATSIAENAGTSITVTATLSGATDEAVTVALSTSGTATEGTDYTDGSGNVDDITISAGATTGTVNFTPTDDSIYEGNETATLAISGVSGGSATESGSQSETITITDNESAPTVTLATSATSIAENAGTSLTLTATLSVATTADVTVALSTSGTATEGTDYTDGSGSIDDIVISAGSTTGTVSFTPTDDSIYDATSNETATIDISGVSGGSATESGTQNVTITITDNESAPTVTLSKGADTIDEDSSSTVTITATLSVATFQDVTVTIDGTGGTGTEGTDFGTVSDITISAGATTGTAAVDPTDDSVYEGNETAGISISGVSGGGASESGSQSVTVTITEDESAPTVTLTVSATSIAENAGTSLTLTATLSQAADEDVTVVIGTSGTAVEGTDYTDGSGAIDDMTISAGSTSTTANFTPTDDSIYEINETATISISSVSGADASISGGSQSVSITLTSNESAPTVTLTVSASSINENAGSSVTITATLSGTTYENVTVGLGFSGATEGTDFTDGSGSVDDITISAGNTTGTVNFTPEDDSVYEGNETVTVTIDSVLNGGAVESGSQSKTIQITDNESAPTVTLATSATSIAENAGSSLTLTATLSGATDSDITVALDTSSSATEGTDYGAVSDITISAGATTGTTTFTPTDDSIYDATSNETATIAINGVSGKSGVNENGDQSVTITITDNESAPTVTLTVSATSIAENAGTSLTLTATLSNGTYQDVTVALSTSGTATEGTDYTDGSGAIDDMTISAGSTTTTANFTPTNDSTNEGNETATIAVSGVSGGSASESGSQSVTITITDDDNFSFSVDDVTVAENAGSATITVDMSSASVSTTTIQYETSNGTATAGPDYGGTSGTLNFSDGDTSETFTVLITNDSVYEGNETFTVTLRNASAGSISDNEATVTITDDESAPTVSLSTSGTSVYDNGSNITLTATSTQEADEDITVVIGTSGTATEGTDYANISDITISAGATSGTATFNPTEDTVNEGSETATISISSVSGADSSTSGTTSVTITITEYALRTATAFADSGSDSVTSSTIAADPQYSNVDTTNTGTTVHPYTQMRINEVHAMTDGSNYLTGVGQTIHIADFNCNDNHKVYDNKTIYNLDDGGAGESTFANDTPNNGEYHCQAVATMAAGDNPASYNTNLITGTNLIGGVAPDADLVLSSIPNCLGSYCADDFARDLDSARGYSAVASNQSWTVGDKVGFSTCASGDANCNYNATEFQSTINTYSSYSTDQLLGFLLEGTTAAVSEAQQYVTALDNFQNNGVVIFAGGNSSFESDVSAIAALPQWYSQLAEAWLVVNFADFSGTDMSGITESEFTILGNPCGTAKEYCLTVDGYQVNVNTYYDESTGASNYKLADSGSSYAAPMVAGGVALIKQAFPNHTPEQITDRILASADNSWFTPAGNTTFTTHGASITHGYHATWGHGLPDFMAAMSPITSNSNPASITTSGNLNDTAPLEGTSGSSSSQNPGRYSIASSSISLPGLLGDAISEGLSNETGYFYDGLNGGFKFNMSSLLNDEKTIQKPPAYNINKDLAKLGQIKDSTQFESEFNAANALSYSTDEEKTAYITLEAPNAAIQKFASFNNGNNFYFGPQRNPFVGKTNGLGVNSEYTIGNIKAVLGYHNSQYKGEELDNELKTETLAASFELDTDENTKVEFLIGTLDEKDTFLFSEGKGALGYRNANPNSLFTGMNLGKRIDNLSLSFSGTLGQSRMDNANHSLIEGTTNVISSSLNASVSLHNLQGKQNKLSFSVSQPNRIESGALKVRIPGLADVDGNIPYAYKEIDLESSGRQLDMSINYTQSFSNNVDIGINFSQINDYNHVEGNDSGIRMSLTGQYKW